MLSALAAYDATNGFSDEQLATFSGLATVTTSHHGVSSRVELSGGAVLAGKVFKAHLHAGRCSIGGGGHYQDPQNKGVVDAFSENWPTLTCDANGKCFGSAQSQWRPAYEDLSAGLSIVIHDTPNAAQPGTAGFKMMCADLAVPEVYSGKLYASSGYSVTDGIASRGGALPTNRPGFASLVVAGGQIQTKVTLSGGSGLAGGSLQAHLHSQPCSAGGGSHYQDPNNQGAANHIDENWPWLSCASSGECHGQAGSQWAPSFSALSGVMSIVVHDTKHAMNGTAGAKWMCADLVTSQAYSGGLSVLPEYTSSTQEAKVGEDELAKISGVANILVGHHGLTSQVRLSGSALLAGQVLKAHLHAGRCSAGGGGHYQDPQNKGIADAFSEHWPTLRCDSSGSCIGSAQSIWAPLPLDLSAGLSIVIHDTPNAAQPGTSGSKMLCADLAVPQMYSGKLHVLPDTQGLSAGTSSTLPSVLLGHATLQVGAGVTQTEVTLSGGDGLQDTRLKAHLHSQPCSAKGGPHYQDPSNQNQADAVSENWPELQCVSGNCRGQALSHWSPTFGAVAGVLSVVVHSNSGEKWLCADLEQEARTYSGTLGVLDSYAAASGAVQAASDLAGISGTAVLVSGHHGMATKVTMRGGSVVASKTYKAHLHFARCSDDGGGHYANPLHPAASVDSTSENWPMLKCDSNGDCFAQAPSEWRPSYVDLSGGLSVVVHDTPNAAVAGSAGNKMLCADLKLPEIWSGQLQQLVTYAPTATGGFNTSAVSSMTGFASLMLGAGHIQTRVTLSGGSSLSGASFRAHLHSTRCDENSGGSHYQDPDNQGIVDAVHENWPYLSCTPSGECSGQASSNWAPAVAAMSGTLSIVVHDTVHAAFGSGAKFMCANLLPAQTRGGQMRVLPSYTGRAALKFEAGPGAGVSGVVSIATGHHGIVTRVRLSGGPAFAGNIFKAHLHRTRCSNADGQGHYYDPAHQGSAADSVHENWPAVKCNGQGICQGQAVSLWRPQEDHFAGGLSIILHDTPNAAASGTSGSKFLCADLNIPDAYTGQLTPLQSYLSSNATGLSTADMLQMQGRATIISDGLSIQTQVSLKLTTAQAGKRLKTRLISERCSAPVIQRSVSSASGPELMCTSSGHCTGQATTSQWIPSYLDFSGGLSIMVEDSFGSGAASPDWLCADLALPTLYGGSFHVLGSYTGNTGSTFSQASVAAFYGAASITASHHGVTSEVRLSGGAVLAGKVFKAHLHAGRCSTGGGGHYQDPQNKGVVDAFSENWSTLTCDANGKCFGSAQSQWRPAYEDLSAGLSIVIHDTPNAAQPGTAGFKMMCADLRLPHYFGGRLNVLAEYDTTAVNAFTNPELASMKGSALLLVSADMIQTRVHLDPSQVDIQSLSVHLHRKSCSEGGGAHVSDPRLTAPTPDPASENWPALKCGAQCNGQAQSKWRPTPAALSGGLSIVVHDRAGTKVLCADMYLSDAFEGVLTPLPLYTAANIPGERSYNTSVLASLAGSASLFAGSLGMKTSVELRGVGVAHHKFKAHLHTQRCLVGGGLHYKIPGSFYTDALSENWIDIACNSDGHCSGQSQSEWVPSKDMLSATMSIVVHLPRQGSAGSKLLCADLALPNIMQGRFHLLKSYRSAAALSSVLPFKDTCQSTGSVTAKIGTNSIMTHVHLEGPAGALFEDGAFYQAGLHDAPCAHADGNQPYRFVDMARWPVASRQNSHLRCTASGKCDGIAVTERGVQRHNLQSGLSVVIQDANGMPMFCSDLRFADSYSNALIPLQSYVDSASLMRFNDSTFFPFSGSAEMNVGAHATRTSVVMNGGSGFSSKSFKAHLHARSCAEDGGKHYSDPRWPGVVDAISENWLEITCDLAGACSGQALSSWRPLASDLSGGISIVVHDTVHATDNSAGLKMFCADLSVDRAFSGIFIQSPSYLGRIPPLARYENAVLDGISGAASMHRGYASTRIMVAFDVPSASVGPGRAQFRAALYYLPCSADELGHPYYSRLKGIVTGATNESTAQPVLPAGQWVTIGCDPAGKCQGEGDFDWAVASGEELSTGLSIVVLDDQHVLGSAPRFLCAEMESPRVYGGEFNPLKSYKAAALGSAGTRFQDAELNAMAGSATIAIGHHGIRTEVHLDSSLSGEWPPFAAHLHAKPCAASNAGGPHYTNPFFSGQEELDTVYDENWPTVRCSTKGSCHGHATSNWVPLEGDIQAGLSIVLHDTYHVPKNRKFLCADLIPPGKIWSTCRRSTFKGVVYVLCTVLIWRANLVAAVLSMTHMRMCLNRLSALYKQTGVSCCRETPHGLSNFSRMPTQQCGYDPRQRGTNTIPCTDSFIFSQRCTLAMFVCLAHTCRNKPVEPLPFWRKRSLTSKAQQASLLARATFKQGLKFKKECRCSDR